MSLLRKRQASPAQVIILGFLGLIVPHIARLFLREDSRLLLPVSALGSFVERRLRHAEFGD